MEEPNMYPNGKRTKTLVDIYFSVIALRMRLQFEAQHFITFIDATRNTSSVDDCREIIDLLESIMGLSRTDQQQEHNLWFSLN